MSKGIKLEEEIRLLDSNCIRLNCRWNIKRNPNDMEYQILVTYGNTYSIVWGRRNKSIKELVADCNTRLNELTLLQLVEKEAEEQSVTKE